MAKLIGICGGSGSGKTTIVRKLSEITGDFQVIPQDNYYKSATFVNNANITAFNWDHPTAFDTDLLFEQLLSLKHGQTIEMPTYDFVGNCRRSQTVTVVPGRLVVLEGILILAEKRIRELLDLSIYVDTPDDIRFIRRMKRDIADRGRTVDSVVEQYLEVVRPGHYEFIEPTKAFADLIIPEGGLNSRAIEVLSSFFEKVMG
jgi:uridine kinase